jgi:hypothetical protein
LARDKVVVMTGLCRFLCAAGTGLLAIAVVVAAPLSTASAYVFTTTDTMTMGGSPAQEIYSEEITSDGSPGPTGSGKPTSFAVDWMASTGGSTFVSANATFTVENFTTSELDFKVAVTNDSNFTSARLTAIGFALSPGVTGESISGSTIFTSVANENFPSLKQINVCAYSGNNCAGGANNGLTDGNTATFLLDLTAPSGTFGSGTNLAATINVFGVKFQGNEPLSYELPGRPKKVPEPASLALLAAALAAMTAVRRRQVAKTL